MAQVTFDPEDHLYPTSPGRTSGQACPEKGDTIDGVSTRPNHARPPVPDPAAQRRCYSAGRLHESDLAPTWVAQFARWYEQASAVAAEPGSALPEPNAMVFATADARGRPSARTVLLKGFDERGFTLFTNLGSRKAREATANPYGSLVFPWHALQRQIVAVGGLEEVSRAETAAYFRSRPRGSQLGAWASRQSEVIGSRDWLDRRWAELDARWPAPEPVPVPAFWGGIRLVPETVEFWQGGSDRLHDRLRYRRIDADDTPADTSADEVRAGEPRSGERGTGGHGQSHADGRWIVERLSP
ncbi:pyridoxamine 5'-phosphate oxidase [Candidatus Frankia meridionalis]|uniref:Pyridoxine/pyridoxamine 5'-phosphate oxidase n=1 Tax=Candidatus Protofrankia datiscae TaxID=2716812 RepID=F8B3I5_9ACTN|nr:Pyridoxine/pyridoxamine 5'-phosphate oxidase [Candidatus Protofrankia datiscae]